MSKSPLCRWCCEFADSHVNNKCLWDATNYMQAICVACDHPFLGYAQYTVHVYYDVRLWIHDDCAFSRKRLLGCKWATSNENMIEYIADLRSDEWWERQ